MVSEARRTGRAAVLSGVLMIAGVEGEWVFDPQRDDGSVTSMPVFALLLATATAGFVLLLTAVLGLRARSARPTRPARIGALMTAAGAGLLVVFGLVALTTAVTTGAPLAASFVAFLLGMLLLSFGPATWALALRRRPPARGVWQTLLLAGVAAFGALAIEPDPWHDISLVAAFAAWSVLGGLLLRQGRDVRPADPTPCTPSRPTRGWPGPSRSAAR